VIVAAPILAVAFARGPTRWTAFDIVGPAVWLFGLSFEAIADHQLMRFKRGPESCRRVMDRGLWRYSRHSNYFGEAVLWWGIFLAALAVSCGYAAVLGPAAITFLLVRVSSVRMLEAGLRKRHPGNVEYARRTSAFIPLPPHRNRLARSRKLAYRSANEEGTVNEELKRALEHAIQKEREAEAFYKEWASVAENPAVVALLAELAATEHGHAEMLSRVTPDEIIAANAEDLGDLKLSDLLIEIKASKGMSIQEAMIIAMKREAAAAALYEELSNLGGETQSLFQSLAKEERRHKGQLEAEYDEQILAEN